TTEIYTLALHDALPISAAVRPDDHHSLAVVDLQRDRAQLERTDRHDGIAQARDERTTARCRRDRHPQIPRLARLLDDLESFRRPISSCRPTSQLLGLVDPVVPD